MRKITIVILGLALCSAGLSQQRGTPIDPRILTFEARPATIRPGESVQLVWQTEATRTLTIDPQVGVVPVRGSKQVTPLQTTTYTLRASDTVSKTVTVTVSGTPVSPTTTPASNAPRADAAGRDAAGRMDGHPDFTGVYGNAGLPQGAQAPPLKPGAEKYQVVRTANDVRGRTTLVQECVPLGIPQTYITPYPWQFIQTPKMLIQVFEYPNAIRFIPLDGRPLPPDPDPAWMGTAVGRWEGDTLVIDTTNFTDRTNFRGAGANLHLVERLTRVDADTIEYRFTVEDPTTWTRPWTVSYPMIKTEGPIYEFACHEGNYGLRDILSGARYEEKVAEESAAKKK